MSVNWSQKLNLTDWFSFLCQEPLYYLAPPHLTWIFLSYTFALVIFYINKANIFPFLLFRICHKQKKKKLYQRVIKSCSLNISHLQRRKPQNQRHFLEEFKRFFLLNPVQYYNQRQCMLGFIQVSKILLSAGTDSLWAYFNHLDI